MEVCPVTALSVAADAAVLAAPTRLLSTAIAPSMIGVVLVCPSCVITPTATQLLASSLGAV